MKSKAGTGVKKMPETGTTEIPEKNWKSNLSLIGVQTVIGFCFYLIK